MSIATSSTEYPCLKPETAARPGRRGLRSHGRAGMAALEVVMTTGITMMIFSFATYWTMRISRIVFSVIGEMVGSPLM